MSIGQVFFRCHSAFNIRSDAISVMLKGCTIHLPVGLEKIDFYPPIHLALDELELGGCYYLK